MEASTLLPVIGGLVPVSPSGKGISYKSGIFTAGSNRNRPDKPVTTQWKNVRFGGRRPIALQGPVGPGVSSASDGYKRDVPKNPPYTNRR
jgi:hypothetical protein